MPAAPDEGLLGLEGMAAVLFSNSTDLFSADWLRTNGVRILIILAFAVAKTKRTLDEFMVWETSAL